MNKPFGYINKLSATAWF